MTQRDLDEAVARLRAASSRNDPTAADLGPDLGPPRGRPETAGQGPLDPDIVDAQSHVVSGHDAPPSGRVLQPRTDWDQPRQRNPAAARGSSNRLSPGISPEARARAEAQLRAAVQDHHGAQAPNDAQPGSHAARRAGAGPGAQAGVAPTAERRDRLVPPAPVLEEADRRNRIGDPATADADVATDDVVEYPRGREPGFFRALPSARRPATTPAHGNAGGHAPLTPKQQRWQRRRRRYLIEEIVGWILVPIILVGLYFGFVWGLAVFGLTLDDVVSGARQAWEALT